DNRMVYIAVVVDIDQLDGACVVTCGSSIFINGVQRNIYAGVSVGHINLGASEGAIQIIGSAVQLHLISVGAVQLELANNAGSDNRAVLVSVNAVNLVGFAILDQNVDILADQVSVVSRNTGERIAVQLVSIAAVLLLYRGQQDLTSLQTHALLAQGLVRSEDHTS